MDYVSSSLCFHLHIRTQHAHVRTHTCSYTHAHTCMHTPWLCPQAVARDQGVDGKVSNKARAGYDEQLVE